MIPRTVSHRLRALLRRYPAVALVGPRQSGKTTLARTLGKTYYDLEQETDRLKLDLEWEKLVPERSLVVLDEAQGDAALFPRLRGAIDRDRKRNGRFLLLGSVSPALIRQVSESLAGRLAVCELSPFLIVERPKADLDSSWLMGGFPDGGALKKGQFPGWQAHYLELLAQRDLPQWGLSAKPQETLRFLKMTAASHGAIWNASEIGRGLGLSYHTVNSNLDFLAGAFLVRRLQPFHANLRKRIIKSPRIYWRDSGLLHSLLGVSTFDELLAKPWVGASWEGFVLNQTLDTLTASGKAYEAGYFRTSDGHEVDLVLEISGKRWAVEVKLSSSPGTADMDRLSKAAGLIKANVRVLVSRTAKESKSAQDMSLHLHGWLEMLKTI
jgi:uncharacterized protein